MAVIMKEIWCLLWREYDSYYEGNMVVIMSKIWWLLRRKYDGYDEGNMMVLWRKYGGYCDENMTVSWEEYAVIIKRIRYLLWREHGSCCKGNMVLVMKRIWWIVVSGYDGYYRLYRNKMLLTAIEVIKIHHHNTYFATYIWSIITVICFPHNNNHILVIVIVTTIFPS